MTLSYQHPTKATEAKTLGNLEEQTLVEDHTSRLASQNNLATMYRDLGRYNAALQMMKHIVEIRRQVLGGTHPARIGSEAWLEYFESEVQSVAAE